LSKVFIPQFSSPGKTSREFKDEDLGPESVPNQVIPVNWPCLQTSRESQQWSQGIKEKEEKILKQVREKALEIEKEAYEKGFVQGEKDGSELGRKRWETVFDSFRLLVSELGRLHQDLYRRYEREMVLLVFALVKKVLHMDLPLREETILETLRAAFQYVVEPRKVIIHLHPKDHQHLMTHPEGLPWGPKGGESHNIQFIADPTVTRGGCFLETSFGEIDATLEAQLNQILSLAGLSSDLPPTPPEFSRP
jgi:flagellar assembly protein FliH